MLMSLTSGSNSFAVFSSHEQKSAFDQGMIIPGSGEHNRGQAYRNFSLQNCNCAGSDIINMTNARATETVAINSNIAAGPEKLVLTVAEMREKWLRIQTRLRSELGEDLFNSWFARMEIEGLSADQLLVSVPTRFLKSWIENHYLQKLRAIAEAELATGLSLVIKVRNQGQTQTASAAARQMPAMVRLQPAADKAGHRSTVGNVEVQATPGRIRSASEADVALQAQIGSSNEPASSDIGQTFDTFMVGAANQLAHAAAQRVAQASQGAVLSFNPLYIHAPTGLGKSHLLNAIAHKVKKTQPRRNVLMLTAERFMVGFIQALRQRDTLSFKDQFQNVDVLLIDDFQFLQGKSMQQEFCHAFNSLVDAKRQVVIAADVPPAQLDAIDLRMRSRMLGGLVIDIEAPDEELRRKIVEARHALMVERDPQQMISPDVLDLIAHRIAGGGRELEGALNRVIAYQQFNNQPITLDLAGMVLRDAAMQGNQDPSRIKIDDILKVVGRHYNVAKADLLSPRRARTVVVPRQIGMYLAKKLTSRSLPEIGRRFGGRDHSTVLHAVRKIDEQIRTDENLAKDVALLIRLVEQQ